MRYVFIFIVCIHGLIHFIGFAKAFGYAGIKVPVIQISKGVALLWLLTCLLFITTAVMLILKNDSWWILSIAAIILSQVLIISSWHDARYGTIANVLILLVTIPAYSSTNFNRAGVLASENIMARVNGVHSYLITKEMLTHLPPVVQKWIIRSGIIGKEKINTVRLKQKGQMRLKPSGNWLPFEARQYFAVDEPAFVWTTQVHMMPFINLAGRDKFENGQGDMNIKLLSLFKVAGASGNEKINSAAMIRYLAETSWFPSAALSDYIKWEAIDSNSAKAIMTFRGVTVNGVFNFNEKGDMVSFMADRYYESGADAVTEKWLVQTEDWKEYNGIRIPYKSKVIWKLKTGDFNWSIMELTALEYNKTELYKE